MHPDTWPLSKQLGLLAWTGFCVAMGVAAATVACIAHPVEAWRSLRCPRP
jgi:hypothetical protein